VIPKHASSSANISTGIIVNEKCVMEGNNVVVGSGHGYHMVPVQVAEGNNKDVLILIRIAL